MRDLPYVAVGIGEGAGRTAPLRKRGWAKHGATRLLGIGQDGADLLGRADVVGELDAGSTVTTERCPQAEDHPPGLKEADLIVRLRCVVPAERLIERTGSGKIGDAKRHEADALLHPEIIADAAGSTPVPQVESSLSRRWPTMTRKPEALETGDYLSECGQPVLADD